MTRPKGRCTVASQIPAKAGLACFCGEGGHLSHDLHWFAYSSPMLLFEQIFARGFMVFDPVKKAGVFNPTVVAEFPSGRKQKMAEFRWIIGNWEAVNHVRATPTTPEYTDTYHYTYNFCDDGTRICITGPSGKERPHLTFDPFSARWMMTFVEGAYGVLHSDGWNGDTIVFAGHLTMLGVDCELRQSIQRQGHDQFYVRNDEKLPDGQWSMVDDFEFRRR